MSCFMGSNQIYFWQTPFKSNAVWKLIHKSCYRYIFFAHKGSTCTYDVYPFCTTIFHYLGTVPYVLKNWITSKCTKAVFKT